MIETFHAFMTGLVQIFAWPTFGLMLLGILIGFFVGLLPGLGGPATIALLLPFVVKMKAVEAFAFLLGMASVTATTGDLTSILFGVPGESTTAATIVDGHPMAKKGESGRAMGAALLSSLIGAAFGAFALAVAIPIVRPLVLSLGSPEFFMLAVLGLTFVASLGGEAWLKGLTAAGMGFFLATIGLAPVSGTQRFTFGQLFLWDGIGLIPISLGFFAIPEIIGLWVQGTSIAEKHVGKLGGVMEGIKDTYRHLGLVIRCSAIGSYAAIIPGIGGATTQWLAYAHAAQSSRNPQEFGKGSIEGVLGPGAANNSTLGGSLITTVSFGVPTSVLMAMLLGAFLVQGLVPGPDMLVPEPKGHLALTFSFVWTIVISNIITVGVCLVFLDQLVKVTYVRGSLLIPVILFLVYLGAFAEKNTFADLFLVLVFGAVGWMMQRLDWPRPPLILGLVLGPLAENKLFLSVQRYGLGWLSRPGVMVLIAMIVGVILYTLLKGKVRQKKRKDLSVPLRTRGDERKLLNFSWAVVFDLAIVAAFAAALWQSRHFNVRAGLFPWAIGIPVLALATIQLLIDLFGTKRDKGKAEVQGDLPASVVNRRTLSIFGWIAGFFIAIWLFGFSIGTPLITFLQLRVGSREKWRYSFLLAVLVWAFLYGLFEMMLKIPFPTGLLFSLLAPAEAGIL